MFSDYFTVQLQDSLSLSIWWLVLAAALVALAAVLWFVVRKRFPRRIHEKTKREKQPEPPAAEGLEGLKTEYLQRMKVTSMRLSVGRLSLRDAYQTMSADLREFVEKACGVRVREMTLSEIRALGIRPLTELVQNYYEPEFALQSEANAKRSFEMTCNVIRRWAMTEYPGDAAQERCRE